MALGDRETAEGDLAEGASSSRRDPLIGAVVNGKYRVESAIARGGMGRIYYATQVPLERAVALKVVQADGDHEHESQFLKRFLQEASILAKLQHPNVVTLFDYGKIEGSHVEQYFIAMEFLAGETLTHRFATRGRLAPPEALVLGRQIVRGLREAHKHGVVHRDLKPSNIILVPEGDGSEIVKLVDFGIGKVLGRPGDAQDLTQDGVFVGTPRYMAPEQFEGTACPASDFYALGTILFQALAGRLPFVGSTLAELMVAKLAREVPTLREVAPDAQIPESLDALVLHLLARRPEDRPSLTELHIHLMACEEEVFGSTHRGQGTGPHNFASTGSGAYTMRQTGSGPQLPALTGSVPSLARPQAVAAQGGEALRVPYTVVASIPSVNVAQMTPHPMAASSPPPAAPAKSSKALVVVVLALAVVLALGVGAGTYMTRRPLTSTTATTPTTSPATGAAGAPSGAAVTQGASSESAGGAGSQAPLVADAPSSTAKPRGSAAKTGAQAAGTPGRATGTAAPANGPGLDIRLKR